MAYFSGDPWVNQFNFGGTGDGTLFYPGTPNRIGGQTEIPVESLRMKGIRDGMEDYELLAMAQGLGLGNQATQIAAGVFPKTYQATTSPQAIDAARAELAQLILHAMGKDQAAPPPPPPAPPAPPAPQPGSQQQTPPASPAAPAAAADNPLHAAGGCSTGGLQSAWLALPLLGLVALRRRRARAA
jgi:hypothetical protein